VATYLEAIRQALQEEMRQDPSVFLIGEDIGEYGGAFKVTKGLIDEFGARRVIDTPISEAGFTGAAIGAAMNGLRPVVEYQFAAFISCGFDQITNFAAKTHYRLGVPVPVVFRAPAGGGIHGGPFHSQCPEMYFVHTPGLKVVVPATAADAKGLLKAAIRDDDPVLYFEHKYLYRRIKEELPDGDHVVPLGRAAVRTEGDRLSIVTYGAMLHVCLDAARRLAAEGHEGAVEVIDLRTLQPLDDETVLSSVRKTGRLLIVHEDTKTGGIAGEITARVGDEAFLHLDAPIRRVTAPDTPVPFSPPMERAYLPDVEGVLGAARDLLEF
jgi:2-oxoisovalerate dehydrogenase E1 component beta subunit